MFLVCIFSFGRVPVFLGFESLWRLVSYLHYGIQSKSWMHMLAQLGMLNVPFDRAGNGDNEAGAMVAGIPTRHLLQTVQREFLSPWLWGCDEGWGFRSCGMERPCTLCVCCFWWFKCKNMFRNKQKRKRSELRCPIPPSIQNSSVLEWFMDRIDINPCFLHSID